jgi:deazaflavin-dependent oxidoreductase (nitroreductase family)
VSNYQPSNPSSATAPSEDIQRALARGSTIDITTTGRRTGAPRRIEIVFHNIDGRLYISGLPSRRTRAWIHNLRADPHLTFHLKGAIRADLPASARVIDDEAERRQVMPHIARAWRRNDIDVMVAYSPLIEVMLATPETSGPRAPGR